MRDGSNERGDRRGDKGRRGSFVRSVVRGRKQKRRQGKPLLPTSMTMVERRGWTAVAAAAAIATAAAVTAIAAATLVRVVIMGVEVGGIKET